MSWPPNDLKQCQELLIQEDARRGAAQEQVQRLTKKERDARIELEDLRAAVRSACARLGTIDVTNERHAEEFYDVRFDLSYAAGLPEP